MGQRLDQLITQIREEKGPFFMARLCLRLDFDISLGAVSDSEQKERDLVTACRGLGYDPLPGARKEAATPGKR
jgi:hypothetical protein